MGTFVGKRVTARGFIVWDFNAKYGPALRQMGEWIRSGRLKFREDIVEGIDKAPRAFIGLLRGENFGKLQVKLGPDPAAPLQRAALAAQHPARWRSVWAVVLTCVGALGNLVVSSL